MFFSNQFCIQGLYLANALQPEFLFKHGSDNVKVMLRDHIETDWNIQSKGNALCTVVLERALPEEIAAIFDHFLRDRLPPEFKEIPDKPGHFWPSDSFASFSRSVAEEIASCAAHIVNVISWRCRLRGAFMCFPKFHFCWSADLKKWTPMIDCTDYGQDHWSYRPFQQRDVELVREATSHGESPPVGYELFRKARQSDDPRASLVMAVAAAEVRTKECIAELAPDAAWLAWNLQSPPLDKVLKKYLPDLNKRCSQPNKLEKIPSRITSAVKRALELRNEIAHKGASPPSSRDRMEILAAVHDLLYILDYYCGHEWALEHLSKQTKQELGLL